MSHWSVTSVTLTRLFYNILLFCHKCSDHWCFSLIPSPSNRTLISHPTILSLLLLVTCEPIYLHLNSPLLTVFNTIACIQCNFWHKGFSLSVARSLQFCPANRIVDQTRSNRIACSCIIAIKVPVSVLSYSLNHLKSTFIWEPLWGLQVYGSFVRLLNYVLL
jgi:hypothetical protein